MEEIIRCLYLGEASLELLSFLSSLESAVLDAGILPARASEQGNTICLVFIAIYIYVCVQKKEEVI